MKKILIRIGIAALLFICGYFVMEYSNTLVSEADFKKQENLCLHSDSTIGIIRTEYEETTMKINKIEVKLNKYTYDFKVGKRDFTSTISSYNISPKEMDVVWYLKSNPSVNTMSNPCIAFENFKASKKIGNNEAYLFIGLGLAIIGIGLFLNTLKLMIINIFKKK